MKKQAIKELFGGTLIALSLPALAIFFFCCI